MAGQVFRPGSAPLDTTFSIANQTGDIKMEFNAEYRFPLFWKLEGALFTDLGNIWNLKNEPGKEQSLFKIGEFYKTLAFNWGTGVRLNFDFLILRLDLGMVAYDPRYNKWIVQQVVYKRLIPAVWSRIPF